MARPKQGQDRHEGQRPESEPDRGNTKEPGGSRRPSRRCCSITDQLVRAILGRDARGREECGSEPVAQQADQPRAEYDEREGDLVEEDRHERRCRESYHEPIVEGAPSNAVKRLYHDGQDRCLEPVEECFDYRDILILGVQDAEDEDRYEAGKHEERAGDQPPADAVEKPSDVDGELLRLGAREQHAVVERVEETTLADPPLFVHQDALHDCDLAGGTPEAEGRDPRPYADGIGERDALRRLGARGIRQYVS